MTWQDFSTEAGQLGVLIAATGIIYRLMRLRWPEVPEAVMQLIAAILSTAAALITDYNPVNGVAAAAFLRYRWITLGIVKGILRSQNVIKSIDWVSSAATKTGAPEAGIAERAPAWFVAALAKGATVETPEPPTPKSPATLKAQMKANDAAVAKAISHASPGKPEGWE
ncbi:MAG TPA: hypothetical protein VJ816_08240 [Gemmatimonadales bacterium]|nr:hypothetical protein [Gemmatimonadales bacterium]